MEADLARKFDLRVPRYTSYPTAPHFAGTVDGTVYRRWLSELSPDQELSLYFHIPYCDTLCWFCGCYTKIVRRYEPVARYLDMLLDEINLVADTLGKRFRARHLHWGGGSPTLIKAADWQRLIERIYARFDVGSDSEIAVEMDPRDTTEDYIDALAWAGVNRASIGVQDFHPEVQKAINRIQPFELTERVVGWLRDQGIAGINMDLMYDLPYQTTERVVETVDLAARLEPDRVALFGYAHVPWMKSHQKLIADDTLPDFGERWRQSEAAADRLVELGYARIGFDHFARPQDDLAVAHAEGRLHRNFQGYTTDTAPVLLGFGASAIGSLPQGYVQNTQPLGAYHDAVTFADFATERGAGTQRRRPLAPRYHRTPDVRHGGRPKDCVQGPRRGAEDPGRRDEASGSPGRGRPRRCGQWACHGDRRGPSLRPPGRRRFQHLPEQWRDAPLEGCLELTRVNWDSGGHPSTRPFGPAHDEASTRPFGPALR